MTDHSKPPPIPIRRRSGPPATQQGRDDAIGSQGPARPSPLLSSAGAGKISGRASGPSQPSPSQQAKTSPQPHTVKPGWRIVYRKDPADLPKMGTGSEPPVWIAGEEWGCPFRIDDTFVPGNPPRTETGEVVYRLVGSTVYWAGAGLGSDHSMPRDLSYHATYFDRREAAKAAQRAFRDWLSHPDQADVRRKVREGLRGRRLACLCGKRSPCHGDVLLKIANEDCEKSWIFPTTS